MYGNIYEMYQQPGWLLVGLLIISVWTIIWKGLGLWSAAKNKQKGWFIVMLILNTMGLLPIIYLIWFKPKNEDSESKKNNKDKRSDSLKKKKDDKEHETKKNEIVEIDLNDDEDKKEEIKIVPAKKKVEKKAVKKKAINKKTINKTNPVKKKK